MTIFLYLKSKIITFCPSSIIECNKPNREGRNSENIKIFKRTLLEFTRTSRNSIFNIYNAYGIKLLTRLPLGLSDLINISLSIVLMAQSISFVFVEVTLNRLSKNTLKQDKPSLTTFKALNFS